MEAAGDKQWRIQTPWLGVAAAAMAGPARAQSLEEAMIMAYTNNPTLLAARAEWVRSIEIEPALAEFASANLERNGVSNVVVEEGDGSLGWPSRAPYDLIVVSAGLPVLPHALLEQLKVGGRMILPMVSGKEQRLCVIERTANGFNERKMDQVKFVPLLPGFE